MRLIINGYNIQLDEDSKITRTLQVNDIVELEYRQSNYSATFKIPKVASNIKAFNLLGVNGNTSNVPYQRNNAYLYSENEECLVYNGWAVIKESKDGYNVNIVDGNIDLYKAIENKTLSSLNLSEANHFKTLDNVLGSFNDSKAYKYILADYNGKALYDTNKINIDYLTPSIKVSYLWDKIFDTYGFTYSGQVFNTFAFQNFYLTYPKGTLDETPTPEQYYTNTFNNLSVLQGGLFDVDVVHGSNAPTDGQFLNNDIGYVVPANGTYLVDTDLSITVQGEDDGNNVGNVDWELKVYVNGVDKGVLKSGTFNYGVSPMYLQLNAGDIIKLQVSSNYLINIVSFNSGNITYSFLSGFDVDFNETLIDFDTKDFLKMVLNRFGLTPFKNKYDNSYRFLTLYELLQEPNIEDWSSNKNKFVSLDSEKYIYGGYAQQNNFLYKYNDDESDYYNGSIFIDNVNLEDSKDVVKSKIYAPEKLPSNELPKETNVYKLWDKEVKDDGSVTYKSLDKRFYLMRSEDYTFSTSVIIGSKILQTENTISTAPFESFFKLKFQEIIQDYYQPLTQILNKARVVNASIYLNDFDIDNIDFSSLKWIEDENSYFLLNKVSNYTSKGVNKAELIKVDYVSTFYSVAPTIAITGYAGGCLTFTVDFATLCSLEYSSDNGITWTTLAPTYVQQGENERCGLSIVTGNLVRYKDPTNTVISNTFIAS